MISRWTCRHDLSFFSPCPCHGLELLYGFPDERPLKHGAERTTHAPC